jgi:hypothetical protein
MSNTAFEIAYPCLQEHLMTNAEINRRISEGIHRPDIEDIYEGPDLSESAGQIKVDLFVKNWNEMNDTQLEVASLT